METKIKAAEAHLDVMKRICEYWEQQVTNTPNAINNPKHPYYQTAQEARNKYEGAALMLRFIKEV